MGLEKIDEYKKALGWTNEDLSAASGVPKATIDKITAGKTTNPNFETARAIMKALGRSLDDLDGMDVHAAHSANERQHIKKYRALDGYGKSIVDTVLHKEHERVIAQSSQPINIIKLPFYQDKVSAGLGNFLSNGVTEEMSIRLLPETSGSDYVVQVTGDSMEPTYQDGDLVLIHSQPEIEVGEVGLWLLNGDGYIKERGRDCLVSHNNTYSPIRLQVDDTADCFGKVLRRLEKEWIL